jgi:hypothetical protein
MPLGEIPQMPGAPAATEDAEDRNRIQQTLGATHAPALTTFRQRLKKGDEVRGGSGVVQRTGAVPTKPAPAWPHKLPYDGLSIDPVLLQI